MITMETPRTSRPTHDEALATVRLVGERIAEAVDPVRVILFGSYARGDYTMMSDVDVCVILDAAGDWFERQSRFRRLVTIPGVDVEPHIYTRDEFESMLAEENPLALRIAAEGKVLYEQH